MAPHGPIFIQLARTVTFYISWRVFFCTIIAHLCFYSMNFTMHGRDEKEGGLFMYDFMARVLWLGDKFLDSGSVILGLIKAKWYAK